MLHGILGFSVGAGSVAILYETLLKNKTGGFRQGNQNFVAPPPAQKIESSSSSSSDSVFPANLIPKTTDTIYAAPSNAYISDFSSTLKTPRWVLEVIDYRKNKQQNQQKDESNAATGNRSNSKFFSNESIPEQFRATNSDYSVRPGLSRGHLAAAQFHKGSQEEMNATFDLSLNIVPQDMTVNACDWFRLEQMTKALSKDFSRLFVLTGPAFVPSSVTSSNSNNQKVKQVSYEVIGDREIAVPTHLFKCLLGEDSRNKNNSAIGCFLMPNEPIVQERPLAAFEVPVEQLEKMTGLSIFEEPRFNKAGGKSWYRLCAQHKCEGSYGSFSKNFRQIGVLRSANTKQELDSQWRVIQKEHALTNTPVENSLTKEYQNRLKNFA